MEQNRKLLLSTKKQAELKQVEENAINAGAQYNMAYDRIEHFSAKIDTEEKRAAIKFILGDLIEIAELGFQMSPIIDQLGDPSTKEALNYREFKLLQEIIKNVRIKGRDNHVKLSQAMKAFNDDGKILSDYENESQQFIKQYQEAGTIYAKLCQKFGIMPEDLSEQVEAKYQEELAKAKETK